MTLTLIYILVAATAATLSICFGKRRSTPVVVFSAVWSLVVIAATVPGRGYLPLADETWRLVFIALVAFLIGCFAAHLVPQRQTAAPVVGLYDPDRLWLAYRLALCALIGSVSLEIIRILPLLQGAGGLSGILSGQGLSFREAQNAAAATASTTDLEGGSFVLAIAGYALFTGYVSLIWAGYYAAIGRWGRAAVPLLLLAGLSLVTLQRFTFVYSLIVFLFSLRYHRALLPRHSQGTLRPLAVIGVLLVAVVFIPLQLRGQAVNGAERYDSVVDYFAGGLAGINTFLVEHIPPPGETPGHGTYTLWGLASIAARVGVPLDLPANLLPYASISRTREVFGNVGTFMIYPYYDFGVAGVALLAAALGAIATWLEGAVLILRRLWWITPASIVMTTIVMSFFGLSLVRDVRWTFLAIAAGGLTRLVVSAPGLAAGGRGLALRPRPASVTGAEGV